MSHFYNARATMINCNSSQNEHGREICSSLLENVLAVLKMKSVSDNCFSSAITTPRFIEVLLPIK